MDKSKIYKFKEVVDKGDEKARFTILEERGNRVLVQDVGFSGWLIQPTCEYNKVDLIEA